jgi:hypothetical protein
MLMNGVRVVFIVTLFTVCCQAIAHAEISFRQPTVFACGASISWSDLQNWRSQDDSSICGHEPYYTVRGIINNVPGAYKISAEIYVPEANRSWPASGGTYKSVDPSDGTFMANFCISQKGTAREFWFQLYSKDKQTLGGKCIIKVREDW